MFTTMKNAVAYYNASVVVVKSAIGARSVLPDFSSYKIPKWKIYVYICQTAKNIPNGHKIPQCPKKYQISITRT
jgi:hypothetical protein